jgi:hypothetical protein
MAPSEEPPAKDMGQPNEENIAVDKPQWTILEIARGWGRCDQPRLTPLLHAFKLLKHVKPRHRLVWYALFRALSRRNAVVDRNLVGDPKNDITAWRVLDAALSDYHSCGLELDPWGFLIMCHGFEKALLAAFTTGEEGSVPIVSGVELIKVEFRKLAESSETETQLEIPRLLHTIDGTQLHAFVRILGILEDYDEMLFVLKWMMKHQDELEDTASQTRNGHKVLRRTFVAMRVFANNRGFEAEARRQIESVKRWGGWPSASEAEMYLEVWSLGQVTDDVL